MTKIAVFIANIIAELIFTERAPSWLREGCDTIQDAYKRTVDCYALAAAFDDPPPDMRDLPFAPSRWRKSSGDELHDAEISLLQDCSLDTSDADARF